ncbi:unnamed protein product, partial [marine sediment metagenome]
MSSKKKVFIALSSGVDSSTAAALMLEAGFDCEAVFMLTCDKALHTQTLAEKVAEKLGIKLYVLDLWDDFEKILDYFCSEYEKGRTPNPCVFCNRYIKFGKLFAFVQSKGADYFATGHYAKIIRTDSGPGLYEAEDQTKDQSYALAMIKRDVLGKLILPLGEKTKEQTRKLAAGLGLGLENK